MEKDVGYSELRPELDEGDDAPLELFERQAAHFTFEGMDDAKRLFAGFSLWRHAFVEARWLEVRVRPDWLWIRTASGAIVVAGDYPGERAG